MSTEQTDEITPEAQAEIDRRLESYRKQLTNRAAKGELKPRKTRLPAGVSIENAGAYRDGRQRLNEAMSKAREIREEIKTLRAAMAVLRGQL